MVLVSRTLVGTALGAILFAQAPAGPVVKQVGDDLYAYVSDNDSSANSTFLVSSDGILVVDTGIDEKEAQKLLAEIRKISELPIRYIVNTHYHPDHQGGNGIVGPDADVISAQWTFERTKGLLEDPAALERLPSSRFRLATLTFVDRVDVYLGEYQVQIYHPGKAHTSGDALVYFPSQRVMAMGDLFLTDSSPAMDQGSVLNWIKTLENVLDGPAETFVPGHFEVTSTKELKRFHDYLAELRDQVSRLIESGASLTRVREKIQMRDYADFRQYPRFRATFADNAEVLYRELKENNE
jgi:glyoxylase-like metal-dependent hydrolase (beta-lactamase superfamily II)